MMVAQAGPSHAGTRLLRLELIRAACPISTHQCEKKACHEVAPDAKEDKSEVLQSQLLQQQLL